MKRTKWKKDTFSMQFNNNNLDPEDFYYSEEGFYQNLPFEERLLL
jgi:hypothetical protein